jgi:hypothetical protein
MTDDIAIEAVLNARRQRMPTARLTLPSQHPDPAGSRLPVGGGKSYMWWGIAVALARGAAF